MYSKGQGSAFLNAGLHKIPVNSSFSGASWMPALPSLYQLFLQFIFANCRFAGQGKKKTNLGVVMDSSSNTCHIHAGCCFHSPNYCSLWFDSMWSSHIVKWIWFLPAKTSFFSLIFLHSCFSMHFLHVFLIICDYTVHLNGLESSPQAQPKDNVRGVNAVLIWSITMVIPYYF